MSNVWKTNTERENVLGRLKTNAEREKLLERFKTNTEREQLLEKFKTNDETVWCEEDQHWNRTIIGKTQLLRTFLGLLWFSIKTFWFIHQKSRVKTRQSVEYIKIRLPRLPKEKTTESFNQKLMDCPWQEEQEVGRRN